MTVRVESLDAPANSPIVVAALRIASTTATLIARWWQRSPALVMSDDWLSEHSRNVFSGRS